MSQAAQRTIFWAEDDPADQFMIREAAKASRHHATIVFFDNGQGLLDAMATAEPEQVVLDVRMPGLDGVQTLERLRAAPRPRTVPVVMFTTALIDREMEACHRLGVSAVVQKPSDFDAFAKAVDTILEGTATGVRAASRSRSMLTA